MSKRLAGDFFYKDRSYQLASWEKNLTLPLEEYGISLDPKNSLTGTGTINEFVISDGLCIGNIGVSTRDGRFPPINDVSPRSSCGNYAFYTDVNLKLDYTGSLLLGRQTNAFYSPKKDCQWPWAFHELMEFTFEHGNLVAVKNQSRLARKLYKEVNYWCDCPEEYEYIREGDYQKMRTCIQLLMEDYPMPIWWVDSHPEETLAALLGFDPGDLDELAELFAGSLEIAPDPEEEKPSP